MLLPLDPSLAFWAHHRSLPPLSESVVPMFTYVTYNGDELNFTAALVRSGEASFDQLRQVITFS